MKLGRATGLILAGWFLMVPPITNGRIDPKAPVSQWSYDHLDYFRTQEECAAEIRTRQEAARIGFGRDQLADSFGRTLGGWVFRAGRARMHFAKCMREDTPGIEWN